MLYQIYSCRTFKTDPLLPDQLATQLSLGGWVDAVAEIIRTKK
jgi:hypothetical protein